MTSMRALRPILCLVTAFINAEDEQVQATQYFTHYCYIEENVRSEFDAFLINFQEGIIYPRMAN